MTDSERDLKGETLLPATVLTACLTTSCMFKDSSRQSLVRFFGLAARLLVLKGNTRGPEPNLCVVGVPGVVEFCPAFSERGVGRFMHVKRGFCSSDIVAASASSSRFQTSIC